MICSVSLNLISSDVKISWKLSISTYIQSQDTGDEVGWLVGSVGKAVGLMVGSVGIAVGSVVGSEGRAVGSVVGSSVKNQNTKKITTKSCGHCLDTVRSRW